MEFVSTPNPHFIPGYTGFCPQYRYRIGDTYGTTTHKLLLDPDVDHAEKLVISDRSANEYQIFRPDKKDVETVNARSKNVDTLYKHPMIPGYDGFVPREHRKCGQRYTVLATEALAEYEQFQSDYTHASDELERLVKKQDKHHKQPEELDEQKLKELATNQFNLPLIEVRPECGSLLRTLPAEDANGRPPRDVAFPDFLHDAEPKPEGFHSDVPFGCACMGKNYEQMQDSAICDFVSNHRKRLSTEWAPANISRPDPPFAIQPCRIYHKHVGQLPNYAGHIPGAVFRYGKTYGNDTQDAKRWLRGDFRV